MSIIPASEATRISNGSQNGSIDKLKEALLAQIQNRAKHGEKNANEYIPKGILPNEIQVLSGEFQQAGYKVKLTEIGDQTIFTVSWD